MLREWLRGLRAADGYRGLVVLHSVAVAAEAAGLSRLLAEELGEGVCVAPAEAKSELRNSGSCRRLLSPSAIEELLGTEGGFALLAVPRLLRPNLVAAAAETVRAGGVLAIVAPPLEEWSPGGESSTGAYRRYLVSRLYAARSIFWGSADTGVVYLSRLPGCCAERPQGPEGYRPSSPLPRRLVEAAATLEQAEALDRVVGFLRRRGRAVFVVGDRGRGKSGLLALTVAYLVYTHMAGFVSLTAPRVWSVQSFFHVLAEALRALGVRFWLVRRHGVVVAVAGPWFHVRYHTPDQAGPGVYTVVDEAAAVGPSRLRALAARSPRIIAATTLHGYEGSGRVLAHMAERVLPEPRLRVELRTPVRYPPGDPLEEWVYETFMLRIVEPPLPAEPAGPGEARLVRLDRHRLAEDYSLLRSVYSILVAAHYRNEPDDLALMLDAPHHMLYALVAGDTVVAAADVAVEDEDTPWDARILYDRLAEAAGAYTATRGWRIVRIAVHPRLQRRGYGTRMVELLEAEAAEAGADWLGAIYGRAGVTRFWLSNGFLVVYLSPLPSRATGEHNVGVAKPLNPRGRRLVHRAAADALARLLWGLGSLYRSLDPGLAAEALRGREELVGSLAATTPSATQVSRLARVAAGQAEPESALDALAAAAQHAAGLMGGLWMLGDEERLAVVARVLQGRTPRELSHLFDAAGLRRLLQRSAAELLLYIRPRG